MDRGAWWAIVQGITESDTTERLTPSLLTFPRTWGTEGQGSSLCDVACGWEDHGEQTGLRVPVPALRAAMGQAAICEAQGSGRGVFSLRPTAGTRVSTGRTQHGVQGCSHLGEAKSRPVSESLFTR